MKFRYKSIKKQSLYLFIWWQSVKSKIIYNLKNCLFKECEDSIKVKNFSNSLIDWKHQTNTVKKGTKRKIIQDKPDPSKSIVEVCIIRLTLANSHNNISIFTKISGTSWSFLLKIYYQKFLDIIIKIVSIKDGISLNI